MSCTRLSAEEHRSCEVPTTRRSVNQLFQACAGRLADSIGGRRETYEFDGNLLVVQEVGTLKNHTKRALANLLPHPIVDTDDVGR